MRSSSCGVVLPDVVIWYLRIQSIVGSEFNLIKGRIIAAYDASIIQWVFVPYTRSSEGVWDSLVCIMGFSGRYKRETKRLERQRLEGPLEELLSAVLPAFHLGSDTWTRLEILILFFFVLFFRL